MPPRALHNSASFTRLILIKLYQIIAKPSSGPGTSAAQAGRASFEGVSAAAGAGSVHPAGGRPNCLASSIINFPLISQATDNARILIFNQCICSL